MDKNRIRGLPDRTSEQMIAKSTAIKDPVTTSWWGGSPALTIALPNAFLASIGLASLAIALPNAFLALLGLASLAIAKAA
jgi:hypothetical protein